MLAFKIGPDVALRVANLYQFLRSRVNITTIITTLQCLRTLERVLASLRSLGKPKASTTSFVSSTVGVDAIP